MSDIISIKLEVLTTGKEGNIDLSEYGMTKENYDKMSIEEQEQWLYDNVIINFDQSPWVIIEH